jgi:hypothetical protein
MYIQRHGHEGAATKIDDGAIITGALGETMSVRKGDYFHNARVVTR